MPLHIELIEVEHGGYTVLAGERFADHLCRDEALGVIAGLLFSGITPPYLRTYEQWAAWQRRHTRAGLQPITALLTWNGQAH